LISGDRSSAHPSQGELHIWHVAFADLPSDEAVLGAILSDAERTRAARFAYPHLSLRWLRGRFALRCLLGDAVGAAPETLTFGAGEHGKPFLVDADGSEAALQFNLSHTAEYAMLAVAWRQAVGVDIETIRPMDDIDRLVSRNFSPFERAEFQGLAANRRVRGFFNGWTRKEAFIKATGRGLYQLLDSFSVSLDPDRPARLIEVDGDPAKALAWTLSDVGAPADHVAAVVVRGNVSRVVQRSWPERG